MHEKLLNFWNKNVSKPIAFFVCRWKCVGGGDKVMDSTPRRNSFSTRSMIKEPPSLLVGHPVLFSSSTSQPPSLPFVSLTSGKWLLYLHNTDVGCLAAKVVGELDKFTIQSRALHLDAYWCESGPQTVWRRDLWNAAHFANFSQLFR